MKQQINKNGVLYESMQGGRTKLTVIFALLLVIFVVYTISISPYLGKKVFGATELDAERFAREAKTVAVTGSFVPQKEEAKIYSYGRRDSSYWQGSKYLFDAKLENIEDTKLAYTAGGVVVTEDTDTEIDPIAVKVLLANIGDERVTVLMSANQEISEGALVEGMLVEISPLIRKDLANYYPDGTKVCLYMYDVRGIDMGSEFSDTIAWIAFLLVLIFLGTKLLIYYLNPMKHPTYKQLEKYGEVKLVIQDIDTQAEAEDAAFDKKTITTKDWILTKRDFYYKVEKNFAAKGNFKYTPYEK